MPLEALPEVRPGRGTGSIARHDDDIHRRKVGADQAEAFANESTEAVASHRETHSLAGNGEAQAGFTAVVRPEKHREISIGRPLAFAEHAVKIGGVKEAAAAAESGAATRPFSDRGRRPDDGLWRTTGLLVLAGDHKHLAALGTPAGQHQASTTGSHAGTETVGPLPLELAGLVGSLHKSPGRCSSARAPVAPAAGTRFKSCRKTKGWAVERGGKVKEAPPHCQ